MSQPDLKKDFKRLIDYGKASTKKIKAKDQCKGQIFRASVSEYCSEYHRGKNAGDIIIGFNVKLRRMKSLSCPGCKWCGWMFEYFSEISLDENHIDEIEKVQDGLLYCIEGEFSPGDMYEHYDEFDYFKLTQVNEGDLK